MRLFSQRTNPKPGRIGPKEVLNYIIILCAGTKPNNFGVAFLIADKIFSAQNITVATFVEKSSKHISRVEKRIKGLVKKWNSPKVIARVITGAAEEYVKNPAKSLQEYGIWHPLNIAIGRQVNTYNNQFGGSITMVSSISQGGHIFPYLDQLRCCVESGVNIEYRIGVLVIPTDKESQKITGGIVSTLRKIPIFDSVIVYSNKKATEFRPVEWMDAMVATGLGILLNRRSYRDKGISEFDLQEEFCSTQNSKTNFFGVSASVCENPKVKRKPLLGIFKRKAKYRDQTINAVTALVKSVLSDPTADLTGLPVSQGVTTYITISGYVNQEEELMPAIQPWQNNPNVHILFFPSRPKDLQGNEKIIAVGFRKVRSPDYNEQEETQFEKHLNRYLKLSGLSKESFVKLWQRKLYHNFGNETEEAIDESNVIELGNFETGGNGT